MQASSARQLVSESTPSAQLIKHEVKSETKELVERRDRFDQKCVEDAEQLEQAFGQHHSSRVQSALDGLRRDIGEEQYGESESEEAPQRQQTRKRPNDSANIAPGAAIAMPEPADIRELMKQRVSVISPFWSNYTEQYGIPVQPRDCLGCVRLTLRNPRLVDKLYKMVLQFVQTNALIGMDSLIINTGPYFKQIILDLLGPDIPENERPYWDGWCNGINCIYHFAKHDMSEQMRQLFESIELQYYIEHVMDYELCSRGLLEPAGTFKVDNDACKKLAALKSLQKQIKQSDPKKSCTYQPLFNQTNCPSRSFSGSRISERQP